MSISRIEDAQLLEDAPHMGLDGSFGDDERFGDGGVRETLGHEREYLSFARRQFGYRVVESGRREEPAHDLGVECGPTRGDSLQRVEEVLDVQDAVLEQIAEAAGGHELDG